MHGFLALLGRVAFSLLFILTSVTTFINWREVEQAVSAAVHNWVNWAPNWVGVQELAALVMGNLFIVVMLGGAVQLVGGLLIFFGSKLRFGAFLLFLFVLPVTLLFHPFWFLEGMEREMEMMMFLKNLAILGATLLIMSCGSGGSCKQKTTEEIVE
jgi:uncharacterized membrane protein YphA (DoxX/SURF4 family)